MKVVGGPEERGEEPEARPRQSSSVWKVALVGGIAIAVVGWLDVLFAWYPPQFGSMEWEFATISRLFDSLPLGTVGLLAVVAGLAGRRRDVGGGGLRAMGWISVLIVLFLLAAAGLYWLNAVPAWAASGPSVRETLRMAVPRTTVFMTTYILLYAWIARFAFRQARART